MRRDRKIEILWFSCLEELPTWRSLQNEGLLCKTTVLLGRQNESNIEALPSSEWCRKKTTYAQVSVSLPKDFCKLSPLVLSASCSRRSGSMLSDKSFLLYPAKFDYSMHIMAFLASIAAFS